MKSAWTGSIGFGLVNISVKLYTRSQKSSLDLDMLDKTDHSHIKFQRINEQTKKVADWRNIVKTCELNGNYVILEDKDLEKASPAKSKLIDINAFILASEVDIIYSETPYNLEPDKSGEKAYVLLLATLQESEKAGLRIFVLRNKDHLCLIKPNGNELVLSKIRFAEEIKKPSALKILTTAKPKQQELKMALLLIGQLTRKFDISKFKDTYSSELMKLLKAKSQGKIIKQTELEVTHRRSVDSIAQLKTSLKKAS